LSSLKARTVVVVVVVWGNGCSGADWLSGPYYAITFFFQWHLKGQLRAQRVTGVNFRTNNIIPVLVATASSFPPFLSL
jgi:hypothetical protein